MEMKSIRGNSSKLDLAENVMLELTPSEMQTVAGGLQNTSTLSSVTVTITITESSAVCTTITLL